MPEPTQRIGIIAPMPNELRPVVRMLGLTRTGELGGLPLYTGTVGDNEVVATRTGIGPPLALEATARLLSAMSVDRVVVTGIAGGIEPVSAVGDLIVPEEVVDAGTGERFRATAPAGISVQGLIRTGDGSDYELTHEEIAQLRDDGVVALDMETAAIARVCQQRNVPWVAFRAISDMAGDETIRPVVMTLVNPDGSPKLGRGALFLLRHPWKVVRMMSLGRDAQRAAVAAATAAVSSCSPPTPSM